MDWILFFYYLGHLLVRMLLLFTVIGLLVCGNALLLKLTFWLLRRKKTVMARSIEFTDAETGKREGWEKKTIWIRKD